MTGTVPGKAILLLAAELVEKGWCQGDNAVNLVGKPCDADDSEAVAWSAMGAIDRAAIEVFPGARYGAAGTNPRVQWDASQNAVDEAYLALKPLFVEHGYPPPLPAQPSSYKGTLKITSRSTGEQIWPPSTPDSASRAADLDWLLDVIHEWNDSPARTLAEVAALFREAEKYVDL